MLASGLHSSKSSSNNRAGRLEHRRNANPNQLKLRPETKTALLEFYRPHNAWLRRLFPEAALEGWDDWVD